MSAPVLSWLLTAQGKPRKAFLVRQFSPCANPLSTARRQVASAQLKHMNKDPHTQPSEPILFPKLRIYFADFPYLLYSNRPEAANLGDLMRLWVRSRVRINMLLGFSRAAASAPVSSENEKLYHRLAPTSKQYVSRLSLIHI